MLGFRDWGLESLGFRLRVTYWFVVGKEGRRHLVSDISLYPSTVEFTCGKTGNLGRLGVYGTQEGKRLPAQHIRSPNPRCTRHYDGRQLVGACQGLGFRVSRMF